MRLEDVPRAFEAALERSGRASADLDAATLLDTMTEWYRAERCGDAMPIEADGDMLLAQWGRWGFLARDDGDPTEPPFGFDLTRQLIGQGEDDESIWQLSVTLTYEPVDALIEQESADRWCSMPSEVEDFVAWVAEAPAFVAVSGLRPIGVGVSWGAVG